MYGELMAGVDHRARADVFIAGSSDFNNWMLFGVAENRPGLAEYKAKMETLAPTRFVALADPAVMLFQFGTEDVYTNQDDIDAFTAAATSSIEIKTYETEHAMATDEVQADRIAFLVEQLSLQER